MPKARGKTKEIITTMQNVQMLIEKAIGLIDTKKQYEIRGILTDAMNKCQDIRDSYDPQ